MILADRQHVHQRVRISRPRWNARRPRDRQSGWQEIIVDPLGKKARQTRSTVCQSILLQVPVYILVD